MHLRSLVRLAIYAAVVAGVAIFGLSALGVWQAAHRDDASRVSTVDAILVLGAAQYDGEPSPVFAGRLRHAVLLYEEERAPLIVVLGGGQEGDRTTEAAAGRDYLLDAGIPSSAVLASPVGGTTYESLRAAASILDERGLESAFLVSDPWHNLRIARMAGDLGIRGYVSATWRSAAKSESTRIDGYLRETFAYISYRVLGH